MADLLQLCIYELQKDKNERNNNVIISYLQTLPSLIQMLKQDIDKFPNILSQIANLISFISYPKNSLIIKNGEKGNDFYITLSGTLQVFALKPSTFFLTEEEYLFHLFKLRNNNEPELLRECIRLNNCVYPIGEDNFDTFVKNIAYQKDKGKMYQDCPNIIEKAKETLKKLHISHDKDREKFRGCLTIEDYMQMNTVDDKVNEFKDEDDKRKKVTIPLYEIVNKIETGQTFGDVALENPNSKRTATLISVEDCYFGVLNKNEYTALVKGVNDKNKKKFFNVIYSYSVFQLISRYLFEKKYYNFFKYHKCERNEMLIKEGSKCFSIYFLLNGEFEVSSYRNIIEVNNLLIQYKKLLLNLNLSCKRNCLSNFSYINYGNEVKENEDLKINWKFKTKEQNEMIFSKQNIRLGSANNRDIIGLYDYVDDNNGNGLINCRCLSNNCEVYYIPVENFKKIYNMEDTVKEMTNVFFIKKLKVMIDKLNEHKNRMYMLMNKKENEKSAFHYNLNKQLFNSKNRLYKLESNSIFNNKSFNKTENQTFTSKQKEEKLSRQVNLTDTNHSNNNQKRIINLKRQLLLPKISNRSNNEMRISKIKGNITYRNLYDNVFELYIKENHHKKSRNYDENRSVNRNGKTEIIKKKMKRIEISPSFDQCKTETNEMNLVDCLIMDKFNSFYSIALNKLNCRNKHKK